jgi:excisionase family DNA binding protein
MSRPKPTLHEFRKALLDDGYVPSRVGVTTEVRSIGGAAKLDTSETEWFTPKEAAQRARCGVKTIYKEVKAGRLRAARVGGRRELRMKPEWVDAWLESTTTPVEVAA